jgi:translocation and assembly module TamB
VLIWAGCGLITLAGAGWFAADRLVGRLYSERRPWLEQLVRKALGQPLELGPYRGLRPLGLAAGRSRFLPAPQNPSSVEAEAVELAVDPLGSLLQRALVLQIKVIRPSVQLRRNARGAFWELPTQLPGREPPRLALRIQVPQPGEAVLHSAAGQTAATAIPFSLRGEADLPLWRRQVGVRGTVLPKAGGALPFALEANWQQRDWRLQLKPQQVPLRPLMPLLPVGVQGQLVGRLDGRVEGELLLQRRSGVGSCSGGVRASGVRWRPQSVTDPLIAERLAFQCHNSGLRLAPSPVAWGLWRGRLQGQLALPKGVLELQLQARDSRAGHQLQARLHGPWQRPNLNLSAAWQGLRWPQKPAQPLRLESLITIRSQPTLKVAMPRLSLRYGASSLQAAGSLWPQLQLRSGALQVGRELKPVLAPLLGANPQLSASLRQEGGWSRPQLQLDLRQQGNPLLGDWLAELQLQPHLLDLQRFQSPVLDGSGRLPLSAKAGAGWRAGALQLEIDLKRYPLERLSGLLGTRLLGHLDAWGTVQGPLQQLQPNLQLLVRDPGVGPLQLLESWRGVLQGSRSGGGSLALEALAPADPGQLEAQLDRRWMPAAASLRRSSGELHFAGDPRRYAWSAEAFPLRGLQFALGPSGRFLPLGGALSGKGQLDLQPLWISGAIRLDRPQLLGLYGRSLSASGTYRQGRYSAEGSWQGDEDDSVALRLRGEQGGQLWARFEARRFGTNTLQELWRSAALWRVGPPRWSGSAADLQGLAINTLGLSLNDQLQALDRAQQRLAAVLQNQRSGGDRLDPRQLQALVDADLTLRGPSIHRLSLNLEASGHVWLRGSDQDQALTAAPVALKLQGPLDGPTSFSVEHLPLALLALFTTVPDGLTGGLSAKGRYALGDGRRRPELQLALALQEASLAGQPLRLERGDLALENGNLNLDWSLRSDGADNSIDLKGTVPLQPSSEALELRVASRGDGLQFLSVLGGSGFQWQEGSADLQLLVRGSLQAPVANGFLRFRHGVLQVAGQTMRELEATVLFDFSELELQQLTARVGEKGEISGSGQLGLMQAIADQPRPLRLQVKQVPFKVPRLQAQADGEVLVSGSLRRLQLGGEIQISSGSLNVQPGGLATASNPTQPVSVAQLAEQRWNFQEPLVVMGQQMEGDTSRDLRSAVPNLPFLGFNNLRVRLGPDLRVSVPNLLNFNTGGLLTLRGGLDPSLEVIGVVRLLKGRLSLFTTTFSLDPDAANVAVFTPSLGLIPYVDVALRTRVSDTLMAANTSSEVNLYNWNVSAADSIDQLQLVKVRVEASGPADRLSQNIRVSSTPPLSQERLLALIGGNSLVGLASGNAGAALATVLGQSLLSPVVSGLSDAFGQRLTFAIYPTYFIPQVDATSERNSRQLPSELVLGTEIGLDITERFNFSVLAAPNRSDLPPQLTLNYQASQQLGVQTSVDTQGRWQSQLQLLLRF